MNLITNRCAIFAIGNSIANSFPETLVDLIIEFCNFCTRCDNLIYENSVYEKDKGVFRCTECCDLFCECTESFKHKDTDEIYCQYCNTLTKCDYCSQYYNLSMDDLSCGECLENYCNDCAGELNITDYYGEYLCDDCKQGYCYGQLVSCW